MSKKPHRYPAETKTATKYSHSGESLDPGLAEKKDYYEKTLFFHLRVKIAFL